MSNNYAATEIQNKYTRYRKDIINVWRDYFFSQFLIERYRNEVSMNKLMFLEIENHNDNGKKKYKSNDIDGFCKRMIKTTNSRRALISAVSLTENYLQDLTLLIYRIFPEKILLNNSNEPIGQQIKLLNIIVHSDTKEAALEKIFEEKIRGIFYGNPTDFFEKDKAKLGFKDTFKNMYKNALKEYAEIINRRNINIHNEGKIDSKYIRETKSSLRLGTKPIIDKKYLKSSSLLLLGMASTSTKIVLEETLSIKKIKKTIISSFKRFDNEYKNS